LLEGDEDDVEDDVDDDDDFESVLAAGFDSVDEGVDDVDGVPDAFPLSLPPPVPLVPLSALAADL